MKTAKGRQPRKTVDESAARSVRRYGHVQRREPCTFSLSVPGGFSSAPGSSTSAPPAATAVAAPLPSVCGALSANCSRRSLRNSSRLRTSFELWFFTCCVNLQQDELKKKKKNHFFYTKCNCCFCVFRQPM